MAIDRKALVTRHNPVLRAVDVHSPLTVGNGEFAFTADVTGMQTLHWRYDAALPLCTMSQWGWHSAPDVHEPDEVELTEYDCNGRTVGYAVDCKPGNEAIYNWLRQNPHRLHLGRIALLLDGREIEEVSDVRQQLHLWEGRLDSCFSLEGLACHVQTACAPGEDTLAFCIDGPVLESGRLSVELAFPYGSPAMSAADWDAEEAHTSVLEGGCIRRILDSTAYTVALCLPEGTAAQTGRHRFALRGRPERKSFCFSVRFAPSCAKAFSPEEVFEASARFWEHFWQTGGAVELWESADPRAKELERRIILSQYLSAVQCSGSLPPQETGLTCNSWYGKFHLEMHPSHSAWMPLWNRGELLERSLPWYRDHLPQAEWNAAKNGYRGARWPKMVGPEGIDSPSPIATLLIWQQPHIIWLLELLYRAAPREEFLRENWPLVEETADFMADFVVFNAPRGCYELVAPIIPVQEEHDPRVTRNPMFEVEYWRVVLNIALRWAERLGKEPSERWKDVAEHMVSCAERDGLYLAHEHCPDTFTRFNRDHPSMLYACGMLSGDRLDPGRVHTTLERVIDCWDFQTLWGWDFGQMAMTATRLGLPQLAVDILLYDTVKNRYVASGNNYQFSRNDLPLYLPGNGTLLLAVAMMCAGYEGCDSPTPGFPKDGSWTVRWENLMALPDQTQGVDSR